MLLLAERSEGRRSVPAVNHVEAFTPCGLCGHTDWGEEVLRSSAVALPAAVVETEFAHHACNTVHADGTACPGELTVDGREIAVLRARDTIAFSLELLYGWADKLSTGHPDTWTLSWIHMLLKDKELDEDTKEQYYKRYKSCWIDGCMDLIQLQNIDWKAGFSCNCWQGEASASFPLTHSAAASVSLCLLAWPMFMLHAID